MSLKFPASLQHEQTGSTELLAVTPWKSTLFSYLVSVPTWYVGVLGGAVRRASCRRARAHPEVCERPWPLCRREMAMQHALRAGWCLRLSVSYQVGRCPLFVTLPFPIMQHPFLLYRSESRAYNSAQRILCCMDHGSLRLAQALVSCSHVPGKEQCDVDELTTPIIWRSFKLFFLRGGRRFVWRIDKVLDTAGDENVRSCLRAFLCNSDNFLVGPRVSASRRQDRLDPSSSC